jgi:hypothetical protein
MISWTFLTYHARVLLCVAHDPAMRLRDIAASLNITEHSAFGIITDCCRSFRVSVAASSLVSACVT